MDFKTDFQAEMGLRKEFAVRVTSDSPVRNAVANTLPLLIDNSTVRWKLSIRAIRDFWRLGRLYEVIAYARIDYGYVVSAQQNGDIVLHFTPSASVTKV